MAMGFSQQQKVSQTQSQRISQKQIQSLKFLAMSSEDLRQEILKEVEKNPALEIVADNFDAGVRVGSPAYDGRQKSDAFQEILEGRADERKSLSMHLTEQLNMMNIDEAKKNLCLKIIGNLDSRGFFILAPSSLLDSKAGQDQKFLEECLSIVQNLDPPGICVENVEKSLLLQARLKGDAPRLALFLLDGHLDFLDPPQEQKILEKARRFWEEQKKLSFNKNDYSFLEAAGLDDVQKALSFIQTLDPVPARNFVQQETHFVYPDIYVENEGGSLNVRMSDNVIPQVRIVQNLGSAKNNSAIAKNISQAKAFLEGLEYRRRSIEKAAYAIVQTQSEFFKRGPGHLVPLKQKEVAAQIQVHESTVSRLASSKYLQCEWGLFPIKYFFTSAVGDASKESVQRQIREILDQNSQKKLSDQKLCDALAQRGIKIARRTVAKYRSQMQMENSYKR